MTDQNEFRLSAWGIRNPIPVTVLFIALVVMGLFAYFKLPVKNFPNVEFPAVAVIVTRNGAAPAEMESQITRQIENSMAGLAERSEHRVDDHAGLVDDRGAVLSGYRPAEGAGRRAHAHRSGARRPAARRRSAAGSASRDRRPADHHVCRVGAGACRYRNCRGSSKTPLPARCRPRPALRRSDGWAAWIARSTSSWTPIDWPRRD